LSLLDPVDFIDGLESIPGLDLNMVEKRCLLAVLTKEEIGNAIVLEEIELIIKNLMEEGKSLSNRSPGKSLRTNSEKVVENY
jgi:hypothetical protein